MTPSSRDRISVDLRGLRASLFERAMATGVSPSDFVRNAIRRSLGTTDPGDGGVATLPSDEPSAGERVRLSLRLSRREVALLTQAADGAGLSVGAFIAGLAAGVPLLLDRGAHADHLQALVASNAAVTTLARNLHNLTTLLRQGNGEAVRSYVAVMKTLDLDIRIHLEASAALLKGLMPAKRSSGRIRPARSPRTPT